MAQKQKKTGVKEEHKRFEKRSSHIEKNNPIKEPIAAEKSATGEEVKYKDSDIVQFVGNGTDPTLPARKAKNIPYSIAKVLVAKGKGWINGKVKN